MGAMFLSAGNSPPVLGPRHPRRPSRSYIQTQAGTGSVLPAHTPTPHQIRNNPEQKVIISHPQVMLHDEDIECMSSSPEALGNG